MKTTDGGSKQMKNTRLSKRRDEKVNVKEARKKIPVLFFLMVMEI